MENRTKLRIYQSNNYAQFKYIEGNRPVFKSNVNNIIAAYKNGINLFKYNPILVDNNYIIYDGQHRYEACKCLRLPIYYLFIEAMDIPQLVILNNAQMKWNITSFTQSFAKQGFEDYQTVLDFSKAHSLGLSVSAEILKQKQPHMSKEYNMGKFKVNNILEAEKIAVWLKELSKIDKKMKARTVIRALIILSQNKKFDFGRLLHKATTKREMLQVMSGVNEQLRSFETLYNWNIKDTDNYLRLF